MNASETQNVGNALNKNSQFDLTMYVRKGTIKITPVAFPMASPSTLLFAKLAKNNAIIGVIIAANKTTGNILIVKFTSPVYTIIKIVKIVLINIGTIKRYSKYPDFDTGVTAI